VRGEGWRRGKGGGEGGGVQERGGEKGCTYLLTVYGSGVGQRVGGKRTCGGRQSAKFSGLILVK
jgi:hypothetical protein